jgi:hypothetical protein
MSELKAKGVEIRLGDATDEIDALVPILKDIDIVISAIDAGSQLSQMNLVDAAKRAGVKRFVPCAFITVAPPGGVMDLRDQEERVNYSVWGVEGASLSTYPQNLASIYDHRRRLLVSNLLPRTSIRKNRLRYVTQRRHEYDW